MTNKEINEFLAERLFGLDKSNVSQSDKERGIIYKAKPDYIQNYQQVLSKLVSLMADCGRIDQFIIKDKIYAQLTMFQGLHKPFVRISKTGDTLGEAICRAAVEYLRLEKNNGQTSNA